MNEDDANMKDENGGGDDTLSEEDGDDPDRKK